MKPILLILLALAGFSCARLFAGDDLALPADLVNRPLRDWQLDLTTLGIVWFFLRRAYVNLRAGGGLYGFWRGLLYGEKTPDAKARDDARVQAVMEKKGLTQPPFPTSSNPPDHP